MGTTVTTVASSRESGKIDIRTDYSSGDSFYVQVHWFKSSIARYAIISRQSMDKYYLRLGYGVLSILLEAD
jgi:hypothetical protein